MAANGPHIVLASRSPQRWNLLRDIVGEGRIVAMPARSSEEAGFEGLRDWSALEARQCEITRTKFDDVLDQCTKNPEPSHTAILAADTIIVVSEADDSLHVLGQPPTDNSWPNTVRDWFEKYYFGRIHWAMSSICAAQLTEDGTELNTVERIVKSEVTFTEDSRRWLDWYLATGEPKGKSGGYGIQGLGSLFVGQVVGSISNVVGLPLRETVEILEELDFPIN
ncbi:MAG: hypothetical protein CMJ78_03850 [Planctomycetaceae bacterium]|nr:hypothetical protein [Planctomycetaceae bacterium]